MVKLETQLKQINKQLAEKKKKLKKVNKQLHKNKEYQKIRKRKAQVYKRDDELRKQEDKIDDKIRENFLQTPSRGVCYFKGSHYSNNIEWNVIEAIKKHLRITKLRESDVEHIVDKLIEEEGKKTEIPKINVKLSRLRKEYSAIRKREDTMEHASTGLENKIVELQEKKEHLTNEIKKPKHYVACTEREKEREKAKQPSTIKAIAKTFKKLCKEEDENA